MNPLPTLALLCLVTVTACDSGDDSPGTGMPTSSTSSTTSVAEYTNLSDAPEHTELTPDAYALTAYGSATAPLFVLDVPAGYERFGLLAVLSRQKAPNGDDAYGVAYWAPSGVYSDACTGHGSAPSPGSTAKEVALALFSQRGPRTTRPRPVTLDGHRGWYLELSLPKNTDLSRCDAADLDYFTAGTDGARHTNTVDAVDRLYVLDASDNAVIIDTGYTPQASAAQIEESRRMVEDGRFVDVE